MPDPTPLESAVAEWETAKTNATSALASFYVAVSALRDSHLRAQALASEEGVTAPTQDPILSQYAVIGACDEAAWLAAATTNGATQPWDTFRLFHVCRIPTPPTGD